MKPERRRRRPFNEETVPSETLFYAPLGSHDNPNVHTFLEKFKRNL